MLREVTCEYRVNHLKRELEAKRKDGRKTPLMGWASWNCFRTDISEEILRKQADMLVSSGLAEKGYEYFNIDDGFFAGRLENGQVQVHTERFPKGMKVLADYVHKLGLKAGIYAEAGDNTCGFYYDREGKNGEGVGLYGHEEQDLKMYLEEWGFDFIKVDYCGGIRLGLDEETQYTKIGKIIDRIRQEQDRSIIYNVCRWQFPGAWVTGIADSWRIGADICPDFGSVLYQLDMIRPLRKYCRPGHVNDLDMLQVGNGMTPQEDEAHFAMWCMASAPLMLGCDLTKMSPELLKLVTNEELIAVNQDKACLQAFVVKEICGVQEESCHDGMRNGTESEKTREYNVNTNLNGCPGIIRNNVTAQIWVKNLGKEESQEKAVAFLNRSKDSVTMEVTLAELGLKAPVKVRDVLKHEDVDESSVTRVKLESHSCRVFRVSASGVCPVHEIAEELKEYFPKRLSMEECRKLYPEAVLVDVRSGEEYAAGHLEGAVSLPYIEMHANVKKVLPDRKRKVIAYCNTGKKSSQAARSLFYLGYENVGFTALHFDSVV